MEAYVGVPNGNVRKSRTILRVVAESRWSKQMVQRVMGTPHDLTPVDDGELDSDEIDASEQPHEAEGEGHAEEGEHAVPEVHAVPRRVRSPCCADLEHGKANPNKNHNEDCRARLYKKSEKEKHTKYERVREERRKVKQESLPPPDFVDLDSADSDRWLARGVGRGKVWRPPGLSGPNSAPMDLPEPEAKKLGLARDLLTRTATLMKKAVSMSQQMSTGRGTC